MTPPWLTIARGEVGVTETPGPGNNPRILEYHKRTKLRAKDDITPWCAAFVCWCLEEAGLISPESAAAQDFLTWGRAIEKPVEGCIVVLKRPGGRHVGFYVGESGRFVNIIGGNQRDRVMELMFSKNLVLGYRMPSEKAWTPTTYSTEHCI